MFTRLANVSQVFLIRRLINNGDSYYLFAMDSKFKSGDSYYLFAMDSII